ncbi:MAG: hypothetical protein AB7O60_06835 [Variibacter sp.]
MTGLRHRVGAHVRGCACVFSALVALSGAAQAESCTRTREYIFDNAFDLPQKTEVYRTLFKNCLETLTFSNVKDAFILKDGSLAVIPRNDSLNATAGTLAQFCRRFPRGTLHFVPAKDARKAANTALAVTMSSTRATPCEKIVGQ